MLPGYADVRDIAAIHVGALDSPPESETGRKRLIISSPHGFQYADAIPYIASVRPELGDRLADPAKATVFPKDVIPTDLERVELVTGFKVEQYRPWRETVLETVDCLLGFEKEWKGKGYEVAIPV